LGHLALLDLLPHLFGEVVVPPAVAEELAVESPGLPRVDLAALGFVHIQAPRDRQHVDNLCRRLHRGESEAIVLATEIGPDYVLMDERAGRKVAIQYGLVPVGSIGVLIRAKHRGLVLRVAPLLDRLVKDIGFRVSAEVRRKALEQAGET
jgi:predicted nucleic acid-binding protein